MDKERLSELLAEQDLGPGYMMIDPNDIDMGNALGMDRVDFWSHHGNMKQDYLDLMGRLERVYEALDRGETVRSLVSWNNTDRELKDTAHAFFSEERAVPVERWEDGRFHFAGDGRHRIMAARELNMPIPVRVIYDELAKKQGRAVPEAWESMANDPRAEDVVCSFGEDL